MDDSRPPAPGRPVAADPGSVPPAAPCMMPESDPTVIFEHFRGSYGSELLTAAVAHFDLFTRLARAPRTLAELQGDLGLARRPAIVLTTALQAMKLLTRDGGGGDGGDRLQITPLAREQLVQGSYFDVGDYIGLAADAPGVLEMVDRLRTNRPAGADRESGTAFIYRRGSASAMEQADLARHFTLALAGRAKNVAPYLAEKLDCTQVETVLDVGGGTGIYSIALLQRYPHLKAMVWDRPEVLRVAAEFAALHQVGERLQLIEGDMFVDSLPRADVVLLSNILHDWDENDCDRLVKRCAHLLPPDRGQLVIHDVFLNDQLDGPLPVALYSAALFTVTEGRAYSRREYQTWLRNAGLTPTVAPLDTLIHCGLIIGRA